MIVLKENTDTVSVIIVTYNRLNYLMLAIDAVLNQTYKSLELIVVADGNQLDVKEYIEQLDDSRVAYFYVEHCGYPAKGRNLGITKSTGKFIGFCDDDDIWELDKLEKQIAIFQKSDNLALCCTNRKIINSAGVVTKENGLSWIPPKSNLSNLLISNYISYSSVLLKKEILDKTGVFPDELKFKAIEDYHLWIRVAYFGEVYLLDEALVFYRVHSSNITTKLSKGAKRNILLFDDLFNGYNFRILDKITAYFTAYSKFLFYTLRGN